MDHTNELERLERQLERDKRRADRAETDGEYEACRQLVINTEARIEMLRNRMAAAPLTREEA